MTTPIEFSTQVQSQPLVHALGWTLLHFLWQGALVAVLLWCALGLLGARSAQVRYAAACLALALLVAAPLATFAHIAAAEYRLRAALSSSAVDIDPGIIVRVGLSDAPVPWPFRLALALDHTLPWLLLAWFAGVAVFLIRLNFGFLVARRMRSVATQRAPAELIALFDHLKLRMGVLRPVRLLGLGNSALVHVPTVIGWLQPVVLVPLSCLTGLSALQIEAILCHELAHVRRHDYLVSVAQSIIEALLFYHPAVWWVSKQVRREREYCCDDVAIAMGGDRLAYARALSSLEEYRASLPALALGANGGVLTMRIRRLLGLKQNSAVSQAAAMAVLTVMITLAAAYLATVARAERKPAEVSTPAAAAAPDPASPVPPIAPNAVTAAARPALQTSAAAGPAEIAKVYQMWLDQDVLWIITSEERTAFLRLTTDADRDRFIAQFWLRRNAPGMPADSYREEHYSRIAYANEHFRASYIPGWQSYRGHIVIAYGRPESIDSHPNGGDPAISPYPYEVWHYGAAQPNIPAQAAVKNIDFVFADECHCGNYRLIKQTGQPSASNRPSPSPIPAPAAAVATLCPPQVTGNQKIPTSSVLARLSSRQGDPFEPATVEKDFNTLWNTGYFSNVRMDREDTPKCVQLVIHLTEKPAAQLAVQPVSYRPAAAAPQPAAAAQPTGAITGLVVDQTGAVLPRAEVTATGSGTGVQTTFLTDNTGKFAFPALPPGRYTVAVDARGFRRLSQPNVEVAAGAQVGLNLKLLVGATSETLDVSAASTGPQAPAAPDSQSPDAGPMRVSSGTMAGNLISRPDPVYPPEAKAAHVQGTVVLHALISKTGAIQSLNVVSGPDMLRKSAIDAVSRWTYKPYLLNGEPREVDTVITVHFTFGGDASVPPPPPPPPPPGAGAQAVAGPVRVSSGTIMGNLISRPDPIYPPEAKAAHIQGAVVLHALIAKSGQIEDLKLISGPKELAESAIDAVKQWVYKPYLLNGEPVEVDTTITVNFTFGGA